MGVDYYGRVFWGVVIPRDPTRTETLREFVTGDPDDDHDESEAVSLLRSVGCFCIKLDDRDDPDFALVIRESFQRTESSREGYLRPVALGDMSQGMDWRGRLERALFAMRLSCVDFQWHLHLECSY